MIRSLIVGSLLTVWLTEFFLRQTEAQVRLRAPNTPQSKSSTLIWQTGFSESGKSNDALVQWEVVPRLKEENEDPSRLAWEELKIDEEASTLPSQNEPNSLITPPSNFEEAEAVLRVIPLKPSDYQPLLRLSPLMSTAETLPMGQWRVAFRAISAFASNTGTGNQNYSVNLDIGLNNSLLLSLFVNQADDPLDAQLNGFRSQPGNFWQATQQLAGK